MNIFVAKLSAGITSDDLRELFEEFGEVDSAKVITDKFTGESKRFGFVEMKNDEEAEKAIAELDGVEYDNSVIVVKKAEPRENRPQKGRGFKGSYILDKSGEIFSIPDQESNYERKKLYFIDKIFVWHIWVIIICKYHHNI